MIDVNFEINGRRINPKNAGDALAAAVMDAASKEIQRKIGSCRCPQHGKLPTVLAKGRGVSNLSFEVGGCCDRLIAEVKRRL
ncbi:MAG: hypothetical protein FAZ92_04060 [Accumulibacter sp.]|jgi:hypothetical protein|uniref:hypothetical protein n=1 Tax=Accumulibacter sp. TaxID=2053492 RepID=UPI0011F70C97|nr:hypothetical protein [Accumulibacter sp.]TLD43693.1 MAG: hypothetical protein FAZ92_04060 [Accumulibacter sp.]